MSDFARYCPKCYKYFSDADLYARHVEECGFAAKQTADSRRQTAAEVKKVSKRQAAVKEMAGETAVEAKIDGKPQVADDGKDDVENPLASAANCGLPSADSSPQVKPPKFKT